jgi:hypothetical protein
VPIASIAAMVMSDVVASTATNWFEHEGSILRVVFWHSIALASLDRLSINHLAHDAAR